MTRSQFKGASAVWLFGRSEVQLH